jgi:peptidoglycan hydrolase-like protein with peptidoglycan-binding domain
MMATSVFAEQLTVKYAAQNYEGPPRFQVQAYNNGSSRPVWSSKSIKAKGGFDTKKFGNNRASLFWQTITFQIEPSTDVNYFRIRFLNDHAAADASKGDRNLFVRWIEYRGERYPASKGKKSANCDQKAWVMACAGSLDIMVNNDGKNKEAYGITNVCGYTFSNGKSRSDLMSFQRGLAKRNLYSGGIDGKFGKGSCSALERWAKCENVGSKVLTGGALAKLTKTEPSARELSCYGNATAPANEPKILRVSSDDSYVNSSGRHTIISVEMKNRWGNLAELKLNGYVRGTRPNGVCLVYRDSNNDKCFSVYDSTSTVKNKLATFNKRDKENITDACSLIVTHFDKIGSKTKNVNSKKLLNQRQSAFTGFAYKCLVAIQSSFPGTRYAAAAARVGAPKQGTTRKTLKRFSGSSCVSGQSKLQIRFNQNVLKSLDLYTSTVDGISGPNYRKAVAGGEKLIGQWSDENKDCLSVSERKILEAVVAARKRGSSCEYLPNSTEIKNRFSGLQSAGVIDKAKLDHEKASGLIWMIDTVSELEMRLSFLNFYSSTNSSIRDCRLDNEELKALKPKPVAPFVSSEIPAETISMSAVMRAGSATLSLVVEGSDLETSLMSKSIFGLNNQVKMDIKFDMSGGSPILDFIVSENDTKINLHFYDNYSQSAGFAAGLKELTLGKTPNDQPAFRIRMLDNGKSNIDNGGFRKLLSKMPSKDHSMISALCGQVAGISTSSEGFEAQFSKPEHKASFRSSLFSNPQVRSAVNKLATQCVTEVRATGAVEASFKMTAPPIVCTAAENDGLASLDTQIAADQKSLLGVKDEINQLQSQRPLFQFKECAAYADNSERAGKSLEILQEKVVQAELDTKDATTRLDAGLTLATRLADLKVPADICLVENKALREEVNEFVFEIDPVIVGIQCPGLDDAPKNPVQIVINEINAEILALLEVHISADEISALETERDEKLQEFRELAARLAAIEQSKASPEQVQDQTYTNASLRQTIDDIEARILSLENEIRDLNGVLANNAGMIEDIDALNQRLVQLSAQKDDRQSALDEAKSASLGAQAVISQRDLEILELEGQISNLEIQMEAASSTASTLVEEVVQLGQDIADTTKSVTTLEANVSAAQALIDNANGAIGQKSQEVSKLDAELSKKVVEATNLSNSVTTLAPQADAAETTVEGMRASLETDYVPIAQFQEKAARLNELTQAVTERTKLIQELRLDLGSIEQEEQLLIKMCVADAQCKAAMGERLGVDQ